MSNNIKHITDSSFEQDVLQSDTPVLVDFWATWCGPCKSVAPLLDQVAIDYAGKLSIAKINVDENRKSPEQYGVRGIPTLIIFKNGHAEATHTGALTKSQLTTFIDQNI